jgi:hypothetical protein
VNALVVVVHRHRQLLLGRLLADHVLIQILLQFERLWKLVGETIGMLLAVVLKDGVAYGDALIANVRSRVVTGGGNELPDNVLALMTKGTAQRIVRT